MTCGSQTEQKARLVSLMDIFDILGPVMVGPSSSHTAGAVRIGRIAQALLGGQVCRAEIGLHGSFAETGKGHGTDRALIAGLLGMEPDDLNIPRSFELATVRGLEFHFNEIALRDAHPNTAVLEIDNVEGKHLSIRAVSVGGGRIRVEQLNGVEVDFTGDYNTLILRHSDRSGVISEVSRELFRYDINIATMSVCRDRRGGEALMVIETDERVPPVVCAELRRIRGIINVTYYEKGGK